MFKLAEFWEIHGLKSLENFGNSVGIEISVALKIFMWIALIVVSAVTYTVRKVTN